MDERMTLVAHIEKQFTRVVEERRIAMMHSAGPIPDPYGPLTSDEAVDVGDRLHAATGQWLSGQEIAVLWRSRNAAKKRAQAGRANKNATIAE